MKRTLITLALVSTLSLSALGAFAAKPAPAKTVSAICPVMKSKIPDIKKAAGKSTYKGKTYYFCCSGCKPEFDKNPAKYTGK